MSYPPPSSTLCASIAAARESLETQKVAKLALIQVRSVAVQVAQQSLMEAYMELATIDAAIISTQSQYISNGCPTQV